VREADERARLSRLLHEGSGPSVRRARLPNHGVRERLYAMAGCHAAPEGKRSLCCEYSEDRCRRNRQSTSMRVQAARLRLWSRDCVAVELLSTQVVRKQAKAIFHFQQRNTLHATSSSTLSNSTNGWLTWQWRSFSEDRRYLRLRIHRYVKTC
jgi:hypothetical protein